MKTVLFVFVVAIGTIFSQNSYCQSGVAADLERILWGKETNGVKVGLYVQYPPTNQSIPTSIICCPYLSNSKTNNGNWGSNRLLLWLPRLENSYQMSLFDEKGESVAKTVRGQELGKPIDQPLMVRVGGINFEAGYQAVYLDPNEVSPVRQFTLQDYFDIKKPGKYRLEFKMRVIWLQPGRGHDLSLYTTNIATMTLPSVESQIEIRNL
jgi:hypothetical protein